MLGGIGIKSRMTCHPRACPGDPEDICYYVLSGAFLRDELRVNN